MAPDSLLIVGGCARTVRKAKDLGLRVVSLQHPACFEPDAGELADSMIVTDFTRWDTVRPLVVQTHRRYRFARAISLTEVGLEPASRFNDLLGLGGTPAASIRLLRDRWTLRRHLAALPPGTLRGLVPVAAEPFEDEAGLVDFGKRHGYPLVVKPASAVLSGAVRVDRPEEAAKAARWVTERRRRRDRPAARSGPERFLVEEYVEGPEYGVETFSFQGRHVVIAITERLTERLTGQLTDRPSRTPAPTLRRDGSVLVGHAAPARLSRSVEAAVVDSTIAFLDAVGVVDGAGHTKLTLSPAGPRLMGSRHRAAGDPIGDLLEIAYGLDLEHYTVAWPVGLVAPLPARPAPARAAAIRFLTAAAGTVTGITGAGAARTRPGVADLKLTVSPGAVIRSLTGHRVRVGRILAYGRDTDEAVRRCLEHAGAVTIDTR